MAMSKAPADFDLADFDLTDFDLDDPELPTLISENALTSGNYPYKKKLARKNYERALHSLQIELVKLQSHLLESGNRIVILFEGRDAAGKGGTIKRYAQNINPRHTRIAALPKPSDREQTQWYFQRYVSHMPTSGETVLFDRSWYNRAVVEPVMGFCTPEQTQSFLRAAPEFERLLVEDGITLFKFWLNISHLMQIKRFHDRRHDPLKSWKLSPVDLKALGRWDAYSAARDELLRRSDTRFAPWTVIRANDKRRARLAVISFVLDRLQYRGKDQKLVGNIDPKISMPAQTFLDGIATDE